MPRELSPQEILTLGRNHPDVLAAEYGREPREGYHLVRNIMTNRVIEEQDGTPYACSVASETYWCS